jgi:hypothetical protein
VDTVESITVVPLVHRLRGLDMALIQSHVYRGVEMAGPRSSPRAKLHLIMGIYTARVEQDRITSLHVDPNILFPQIAVDQHWLNVSTIGLESTKESGNNNFDDLRAGCVVFWPGTVGIVVISDHIVEQIGETRRPCLFPFCCAFKFAAHCRDVESEHAGRRFPFAMHFGNSFDEACWFWSRQKVHIVVVSKEEVNLGVAIMILSPPCRSRYKTGNYLVDSTRRSVLAFSKRLCTLAGSTLRVATCQ